MIWVLLALIAHAGNGLVFIVDKGLLGTDSGAGNPKKLAFYSGLLSAAAIVLAALDFAVPNLFAVTWSLVGGVLFVGALWLFFAALDSDEASRVVPVTGSAVPIFTLLFAWLFLQEPLTSQQIGAVLLLIAGGGALSIGFKNTKRMSAKTWVLAIAAGAAFAAYFAAVKFLYDNFNPFWSAFAYSRFAVGVAALLFLGPLMWVGRGKKEKSRRISKKKKRTSRYILTSFFGSKVLSTAMFMLQSYAIDLGSVTVVNALQGTQYVFVLVVAALLSKRLPKLFHEEVHRVALIQKGIGILLISGGLVLLL
ncbi:MAG: EamA family transporter [Candidatus Andersenbacteria bacterium]|nr:EamA family transporter [Candidatus Andersenbacteria bacterium]MBI3251156.1 EamA family transporter [Candidatus Andersenbacteria bacterium]